MKNPCMQQGSQGRDWDHLLFQYSTGKIDVNHIFREVYRAKPMIELQEFLVVDVQLSRWDDAYRMWLDSQASANTRRAYDLAVRECVIFCEAQPWEIGTL